MNISTGGPHILFFERDQQLTALLTSEFQLAGYECHAARTAVEVFDTIARFPVRMLLVDLAQAAAGRREFWVALDTQRRGRGVQVLTYLCSNLAGYGPRDVDERPQYQAVDVEVDGMLGLMNLVDAVREHVPGPNAVSSLNTQPRMPKVTQTPPSTPNFTGVPTTPRQTDTENASFRTGPLADTQSVPRSAPVAAQTVSPATTINPQSYSEKIRAVLYPAPTQRVGNTQEPANYVRTSTQTQEAPVNTRVVAPPQATEQTPTHNQETPQRVTYYGQQGTQQNGGVQYPAANTSVLQQNGQENSSVQYPTTNATTLQQLAYGSGGMEQESGLDQLSRLLQERRNPVQELGAAANDVNAPYEMGMADNQQATINYVQVPQTPRVTESLDSQSLRAAPIEDLPRDRISNSSASSDTARRSDTNLRSANGQYSYASLSQNNQPSTTSSTPLASIATLRTQAPVVAKATMPIPAVLPVQNTPLPVEEPAPTEYFSAPVQQAVQEPVQEPAGQYSSGEEAVARMDTTASSPRPQGTVEDVRNGTESQQNTQEHLHQEYTSMQNILQGRSGTGIAPNNALLLDIVQSLPMMPSPPPQPQPQALSGRTMRTLGSVLLEGHLVPENRLEVAQNIQRMLRGVDLNYQLGEILLMFKLLTPDQLLAASLVSYGMISTQQISALGRIRQELHSIGLEYDLESLLILFRMLTTEQLREIRTSWIS